MDNAPEYFTKQLQSFYAQEHITTHPTIPYTPQENALAERVNRTLMETVRTLLHTSQLPLNLWEYALHAAVDHHNHSPHSAHGKPPITIWTGQIPDVTPFLPFGQYGYIHDRKPRTKLDTRAQLRQYIGRLDTHHYHIYNPQDQTITRCRKTDFHIYNPNTDPTITIITTPITHHAKQTKAITHDTPEYFSSPKTLAEARQAPDAQQWAKSWNKELDSLEKRGTITYIPASQVPNGAKLLPVKIVLKTKTDAHGNPVTRKTRCNIRGDLQRPHEHLNPDELSSPVADRDAIRLSLALAAANNYSADHWDLESAFLHETFADDKTLYIYQPQRFDGTYKYPGRVGKVTGNMYGARQACHIFTKGLSQHLKVHNFTRLSSDSCTYHLTSTKDPSQFLFCVITVDDFLVIYNNKTLCTKVKENILKKYTLKDLGPVSHILGWKVTRDETGITITQPAYIETISQKFGQTNAKPSDTPIASDLLNAPKKDTKPLDTSQYNYNTLIGCLRYLADSTRPDIALITGYLGRYAQSPTTFHWKAGLRVIRYLLSTANKGIHYNNTLQETLRAYTDSDFAACITTRRSTSGTLITYNQSPIAWQSKRQRLIATSTWAAEYIAAFHTAQHIMCIRNLLKDLQHIEHKPTTVHIDNAGALKTANTEHPTPKSKHIDVKYHYLKELIQHKHITLEYIPSTKNAADILTKALKPAQYKQKLDLLRLSQSAQRGDCRMIKASPQRSQRKPTPSDDHQITQ